MSFHKQTLMQLTPLPGMCTIACATCFHNIDCVACEEKHTASHAQTVSLSARLSIDEVVVAGILKDCHICWHFSRI